MSPAGSARRLVSTIIPVHNRPDLVVGAVASVLAQSHRPIEVIVVDDGSTDATPRVLDGLRAEHPDLVQVLRHERPRGPGAARETGRTAASGAYVQYLDSDDLLVPTKFERQVAALEDHPDWGLVIGDVEIRHIDGPEPHSIRRSAPALTSGFPALLADRPWETLAPLYRASVLERVGPWLPLFNEEDWEYDGRIAALGAPMGRVEGVVGVVQRRGSDHLSGIGRGIRRSLASRGVARPLLMAHGLRAGVAVESPGFQHAVRALFLLARQCGAAGLPHTSERLVRHVAAWSRPQTPHDLEVYMRLGRLVGWRAAGVLATTCDRMRAVWR